MPRVKRGVIAHKRREKILKYTKGFRWSRKSKERAAKEALVHAWKYAFRDRRKKKGEFRKLWQIRINAASRSHDLPYRELIAGLKKANIILDRKSLSALAQAHPDAFTQVVERAKRALA
ncbi:50S ribosomal protein L20 [Candidatus Parcubacteria bacterium]|nr:50S ribosomal protein L20 [Candidatus Parcubacteria bacterium]